MISTEYIQNTIDLQGMRDAMRCIRYAKTDEEAEEVANMLIGVMDMMKDMIMFQNKVINNLKNLK